MIWPHNYTLVVWFPNIHIIKALGLIASLLCLPASPIDGRALTFANNAERARSQSDDARSALRPLHLASPIPCRIPRKDHALHGFSLFSSITNLAEISTSAITRQYTSCTVNYRSSIVLHNEIFQIQSSLGYFLGRETRPLVSRPAQQWQCDCV